MTPNEPPSVPVDWVTPRFQWSPGTAFLLLKKLAQSDMDTIQKLDGRSQYAMNDQPTESRFVVVRKWDASGIPYVQSVSFALSDQGIAVKDAIGSNPFDESRFVAIPELDQHAVCCFRIEGKREPESSSLVEPWHVSRKALEPLFFPSKESRR